MSLRSFKAAILSLLISSLPLTGWAESRAEQAWQLIDQGALVVDVRTAGEFASGHLDNAVNIPYQQVVEQLMHNGIDKDRSIVLYCRSGNRSGKAEQLLTAAGYQNLHNGGGLGELLQAAPK